VGVARVREYGRRQPSGLVSGADANVSETASRGCIRQFGKGSFGCAGARYRSERLRHDYDDSERPRREALDR
jgi:hypothetical protein